jgi:hypothetical protein
MLLSAASFGFGVTDVVNKATDVTTDIAAREALEPKSILERELGADNFGCFFEFVGAQCSCSCEALDLREMIS